MWYGCPSFFTNVFGDISNNAFRGSTVWVPSVLEQKGIPQSSRQLQVSKRSAYSLKKVLPTKTCRAWCWFLFLVSAYWFLLDSVLLLHWSKTLVHQFYVHTSLLNEGYTVTPSSKLYIVAATDTSSRDPIMERLLEGACEITLAGLDHPVSY